MTHSWRRFMSIVTIGIVGSLLYYGCSKPSDVGNEVEEYSVEVTTLPELNSFSRRLAIDKALFTIGTTGGPKEFQMQFKAEGYFDVQLDGEPDVDFMQATINDMNQKVTAINLIIEGDTTKIPAFSLSMDNFDVAQAKGTFSRSTGKLMLDLPFEKGFPKIPGVKGADTGFVFHEEGTLDLSTGVWATKGSTQCQFGGVQFTAETDEKGGKSHPDDEQLVAGLNWALSSVNGGDMATILERSKRCFCRPTCRLAAEQYVGSELAKKMVLDVGLSVIEGTIKGAMKGVSKGAKKVLEKVLDQVKKIKEENRLNLSGEGKVELKTKKGVSINKDCTVKYALTYNKETSKVLCVIHCTKCNKKKSCVLTVSYTANSDGLPKKGGRVTVRQLK